jgi:RNA polymerase sigma-70 factor (ECF subfamily)
MAPSVAAPALDSPSRPAVDRRGAAKPAEPRPAAKPAEPPTAAKPAEPPTAAKPAEPPTAAKPAEPRPAAKPAEPDPPAAADPDAFLRSLYAEHSASLRVQVGRILSDPHQAEDVVQETMLRAWRKSDTLSPDRGSIGGWLYTVARNIARDRIRARQARPTEVEEAYSGAAAWSVADHADETVDAVFVARALAVLSPNHRAVLREVYFADRTCGEAAKVLGIPEGTVKSRLYYALRRLRLAIEEERI